MTDRYSRQQAIGGWDQSRLASATVLIAGSGWTGFLASLRAERVGAAPPPVYRTLDFLRQQGLVHRIESLNAFVGCPDPDTPHGGQFLICRDCGLAAELNDAAVDLAIRKSAAAAGFAAGRKIIEIEGLCPHCRYT